LSTYDILPSVIDLTPRVTARRGLKDRIVIGALVTAVVVPISLLPLLLGLWQRLPSHGDPIAHATGCATDL
jgi:hypothetical protein